MMREREQLGMLTAAARIDPDPVSRQRKARELHVAIETLASRVAAIRSAALREMQASDDLSYRQLGDTVSRAHQTAHRVAARTGS